MKTEPIIDDSRSPVLLTGWGLVLRPRDSEPAAGMKFLPAQRRFFRGEVMTAARFMGVWTFAATGCFLPWGGSGWRLALSIAGCLAAWPFVWFLAVQGIVSLAGALGIVLEKAGVLSRRESMLFCTGTVLVILTVAACVLLSGKSLVCGIVGGLWLIVIGMEGLLRAGGLLWKMALTTPRSP